MLELGYRSEEINSELDTRLDTLSAALAYSSFLKKGLTEGPYGWDSSYLTVESASRVDTELAIAA